MQLLVLIAVGYITGILWGLYLKVNIVPIIFLLGLGVIFARKINCINKYKLYITIFIIILSISNFRINLLEDKFDNLYNNLEKAEIIRSD